MCLQFLVDLLSLDRFLSFILLTNNIRVFFYIYISWDNNLLIMNNLMSEWPLFLIILNNYII